MQGETTDQPRWWPMPDTQPSDDTPETAAQRRARRAQFLRDLMEARALRDRVQPRRARAARMRQQMRMRTFRW
ncbi:hypothetical protein MRQ86_19385 [Streptomyces sp. MMS21 TC-5]|nr:MULTISPECIES: hypothetical protein [Streptomyces]MCI4082447.1 hypothetical protein [Streptomyces sp. MMS21 TC-5]MEC4570024.1 hypothetical protein [Streptomyces sp. CMAA1738]